VHDPPRDDLDETEVHDPPRDDLDETEVHDPPREAPDDRDETEVHYLPHEGSGDPDGSDGLDSHGVAPDAPDEQSCKQDPGEQFVE